MSTGKGDTQELLSERGTKYGEAWLTTGLLLKWFSAVMPAQWRAMLESDFGFAWVMILAKLVRATNSPHHADHWRDIAGYATLVSNAIEETEGKDEVSSQ